METLSGCQVEGSLRHDGQQGHVDVWLCHAAGGERFLLGRPKGYLGHDEVAAAMKRLAAGVSWGTGLPTIWDFRGYDFAAYRASEFRSHVFIMPKIPARKGLKRGYLVDDDTGFGLLRMFQEAASGFNLEAHGNLLVSYDKDELLAWLLGDAPGDSQVGSQKIAI